MGQADAGDNEAKLMTKLSPEWVRTSDPVIRSQHATAGLHWCSISSNIACYMQIPNIDI